MIKFVGCTDKGLEFVQKQLKPSVFHKGDLRLYKWLRQLYRNNMLAEVQLIEVVPNKNNLKCRRNHWVKTYRDGDCRPSPLTLGFN